MTGRVEALWIKPARKAPMDRVEAVTMEEGLGIVGNANQKGWRQVTIIQREKWEDALEDLGAEVDPAARRANLMLAGVDLVDSAGRVLRVGECRVRLHGETTPCYRMDEAHPGLQDALEPDWRGGAYGSVLEGGEVRQGDSAELLEAGAKSAE